LAGNVACIGTTKMHTKSCLGEVKGRDHSEDIDVDGKDIIRMDLRDIHWEDVDWMHLAETNYGLL